MNAYRQWSLRALLAMVTALAILVALRANAYHHQVRAAKLIQHASGCVVRRHDNPQVFDRPHYYVNDPKVEIDGSTARSSYFLTIPRKELQPWRAYMNDIEIDHRSKSEWSWFRPEHGWNIQAAVLPLARIDEEMLCLLNALPDLRYIEVTEMANAPPSRAHQHMNIPVLGLPPEPDPSELTRLKEVIEALPHVEIVGEFVYLTE